MTTTPNEPVKDEDIETVGAPSGPASMGLGDEKDADSSDGDSTDASDGDSGDADSTDSTDGADADGTDA